MTRDGRDLLDRALGTAPALIRPIAGGMRRLEPGSPLRRRMLNMQVRRAFDAMARGDLDVMLLSYEPDAEVWMGGLDGVGVSGCFRGHADIRALFRELDEVFSEWAWSVRELADGGDHIAIRCDFRAVGRSSGAETSVRDGGTAARLSPRGLVARQDWFGEQGGWAKALEAAGLHG